MPVALVAALRTADGVSENVLPLRSGYLRGLYLCDSVIGNKKINTPTLEQNLADNF